MAYVQFLEHPLSDEEEGTDAEEPEEEPKENVRDVGQGMNKNIWNHQVKPCKARRAADRENWKQSGSLLPFSVWKLERDASAEWREHELDLEEQEEENSQEADEVVHERVSNYQVKPCKARRAADREDWKQSGSLLPFSVWKLERDTSAEWREHELDLEEQEEENFQEADEVVHERVSNHQVKPCKARRAADREAWKQSGSLLSFSVWKLERDTSAEWREHDLEEQEVEAVQEEEVVVEKRFRKHQVKPCKARRVADREAWKQSGSLLPFSVWKLESDTSAEWNEHELDLEEHEEGHVQQVAKVLHERFSNHQVKPCKARRAADREDWKQSGSLLPFSVWKLESDTSADWREHELEEQEEEAAQEEAEVLNERCWNHQVKPCKARRAIDREEWKQSRSSVPFADWKAQRDTRHGGQEPKQGITCRIKPIQAKRAPERDERQRRGIALQLDPGKAQFNAIERRVGPSSDEVCNRFSTTSFKANISRPSQAWKRQRVC